MHDVASEQKRFSQRSKGGEGIVTSQSANVCKREKKVEEWSGVEWEEKRHGWHLFFRFGESVLFFGDAISPNLT